MTHTHIIVKSYDETVNTFIFPDYEAEKILKQLLEKQDELAAHDYHANNEGKKMTDNYKDIPIYYWYSTRELVESCIKKYYYNGKTYVGYNDEPEPDEIDKYKLTFIGVGDMTMIGVGK